MNAAAPATALSPLRVLIVDDEEPARWRLHGLVEGCPSPRAEVVGALASAAQARVWLAEHDCDVVLLDIAMPGPNGLAFAEELRHGGRAAPAVVFVTAHAEHALQAFELAATDYLTKPVRRERLQAALQRVDEQRSPRALSAPSLPAQTPAEAPMLVVTDRGRVLRLPLAEVLYLKAELKYVTVRTALRSLVLDDSLSELEARLGPAFLRIHRNALVARHAVRALERRVVAGNDEEPSEAWAVRIAQVDEWLAVSRRQVQAVREALLVVDARRVSGA
jgi:two-component system, LytTR family, response regulator AlgR